MIRCGKDRIWNYKLHLENVRIWGLDHLAKNDRSLAADLLDAPYWRRSVKKPKIGSCWWLIFPTMETLISGQFGNFCSAVSLTGSCNIKGCQIAQIWQLNISFQTSHWLHCNALVWFLFYNCYQWHHIWEGVCNGWLRTGGVGEPLSSLLMVLIPADDSGIRRVGSTRFLSETIFVMISIIIIIVAIVSILITLDQVHQGL